MWLLTTSCNTEQVRQIDLKTTNFVYLYCSASKKQVHFADAKENAIDVGNAHYKLAWNRGRRKPFTNLDGGKRAIGMR